MRLIKIPSPVLFCFECLGDGGEARDCLPDLAGVCLLQEVLHPLGLALAQLYGTCTFETLWNLYVWNLYIWNSMELVCLELYRTCTYGTLWNLYIWNLYIWNSMELVCMELYGTCTYGTQVITL